MTAAAALLREFEGHGVELTVAGDTLRWRAPPGAMTPEMQTKIKAHKSDIIDALSGSQDTVHADTPLDDGSPATPSGATAGRGQANARCPREWDEATAAHVAWFRSAPAPSEPFYLQPGVTIVDPVRYWAALRADVAQGPSGPRAHYGAL